MLISARNQLAGKISNIKTGAINSEIELDIDGEKIISIITNDSVEALKLQIGSNACAIIKASWIILSKEKPNGISARNVLSSKVTDVIFGSVNAEIKLQTGSKTIVATITNESAKDLDFKTGDNVFAIFKASSVILGV